MELERETQPHMKMKQRLDEAKESGAESGTVQKKSGSQHAGIQKTLGFATTRGQDYEVALCCLLFLRALKTTSDFFLVSNHAQAGKFDDVVLFYRLKGDQSHRYRAILLQAKHKDRFTKKKLTSSNPFRLKEYLESFTEVKSLWETSINIKSRLIEVKEVFLVLYTNTGCLIGDVAVDVTDVTEFQHLQHFLNTRGRLLRISKAHRVKLPQGQLTSDFLGHLLLCTEQMSVGTVDHFLEKEICIVLKLTSMDFAKKLNSELKRVVKTWWSDGTGHYLTAESEEWCKVLEMQAIRLNNETLTIDRQLNLDFTAAALSKFDAIHRRRKMSWICVRDEYQANAVRSRLFRAQSKSLVIDTKSLISRFFEVQALWGQSFCPILVVDMSKGSREEDSLMLQRLQKAFLTDTSRYLIIIAKEKPKRGDWKIGKAVPTWSVLHQDTRERLLSLKVELQGNVVSLRDVVGFDVSDLMTDEVINSLSVWKKPIKLSESMPSPQDFYVPRCVQRLSSKTINFDSLQNTNTLIFSRNYIPENYFPYKAVPFKTSWSSDVKRKDQIEGPIIVKDITLDSEIRKLCCRCFVRGIRGEIGKKRFRSNVTEFIPFTRISEEKIVVVEGVPGVGKSSFVTAMCSTVNEKFPEAWVLRLDMGRHTDYMMRTDFRNDCDIKELLLKGLPQNLNILERRLLEHSLTVTGNVFLFLDAFDEVSPDFTRKCCVLLKGIVQKVRYRQMVVTTRPVTTKDVEEALETKSFSLPVFSKEEQILFLERFSAARGNNVGEREIAFLRQSVGPVLEIPLLCKMAAEVLLHHQDQLLLKCLYPWRRVLLYELFVEQSVKNRLTEKFGLEASAPVVKKLLESNEKQHLRNLQGLAVRKLMPVNQFPRIIVSTETPEEKFGLVVNIGGRVEFEHRTFAEYFLGRWLACHWKQCPGQLLRDVLLQNGFEFVVATVSWWLFKGFPLHMAVAQGDEVAVRKLLSSGTRDMDRDRDRGGRSVLHVASMTQGCHREVWNLLVDSGEDLNKKDDVLGTSAIRYAEIFKNRKFVNFLLGKGADLKDLKIFANQFSKDSH